MQLPLVATALSNSLGTSLLGTVGDPKAIVTVTLPSGTEIQPGVDVTGNFVVAVSKKDSIGTATVVAVLPDDLDSWTKTEVELKAPKPIVTAIISTHGNTRSLEGSVNQSGLFVEVQVPEDPHPIQVPIDEHLEFKLPLPIALQPKDLKVTALNPLSGEKIDVKVELGVTTKTMTIPILTEDMIEDYARQAEMRRASKVAHDEALIKQVADKEAFVTSIIDTISVNSDAPAVATQIAVTPAAGQPEETVAAPTKKRGFFGWLFGRK